MLNSVTTVNIKLWTCALKPYLTATQKPNPFHGQFRYNSCAKNTTISSTLTHPQVKTVVWTSNVHRLASANGTTKLIASNLLPPRVIASTNHYNYNIIYPQADVSTRCFRSFLENSVAACFCSKLWYSCFKRYIHGNKEITNTTTVRSIHKPGLRAEPDEQILTDNFLFEYKTEKAILETFRSHKIQWFNGYNRKKHCCVYDFIVADAPSTCLCDPPHCSPSHLSLRTHLPRR